MDSGAGGGFKDTKAALAQAAMLAHPHTAPIAITTDASDYAVGAVYEQWVGGAWQPSPSSAANCHPVSISTAPLTGSSLDYGSPSDTSAFYWRAVSSLPMWTISPSRSLCPKWQNRGPPASSGSSLYLEFTTDIQHVAGKSNLVADCLSRAVVGAVQLGLTTLTWPRTRPLTPLCRPQNNGHRATPGGGSLWRHRATLLCDISTGQPRPVVPVSWRRPCLRRCMRRFDHVNADLVGPLPPSHGYTYLFTMVDRTTRWPEAVPSPQRRPRTWARHSSGRGSSGSGTPPDLSSDRGPQFTPELWSAVAEGLGVKLHRTTAYHPQANGLCERFHRSMKAAPSQPEGRQLA
ncbi:hypothetical protein AAFF_G00425880 [Aldrovandia affinis]|uniref:Integrase catalytic domain-containing protein n=1 Tax=Aldrovandia affinis TaxID=143900 RepID=A0AAD7T835_9TELE|nr:hypothetical protein AAFF_G00425880 [Aldrovandia affinis]